MAIGNTVIFLISFLVLSFILTMSTSWVQMEVGTRQSNFNNLGGEVLFEDESSKSEPHEVSFHLIGRNGDALEKHLMESSNPKSPTYGKHLTREEVREMTTDFEGLRKVEEFLQQLSQQASEESMGEVTITKKTDSAISAQAQIGVWEKAFNTTFFRVNHTKRDGTTEKINRARQYFLPEQLAGHVRMVMGTVQMPTELSRGPVKIPISKMHMEPAHN